MDTLQPYSLLSAVEYHGPLQVTTKSAVTVGSTGIVKYLICDANGKNIGIPLYKIINSNPEIDFLTPYTDLVINNATFADNATDYQAGIAINLFNNLSLCNSALSTVAVPIFKIDQNNTAIPAMQIKNPLLVSNLTVIPDTYIVASIDNEAYGIPISTFSTTFPFTNSVTPSEVNITTEFEINPTQFDAPRDAGSTNLNPKIKTYTDLIKRIKMHLGWPVVQLELCDEQIVEHIDHAIEFYSKYAGYTEEILVFDSNNYQCGYGLPIDKIITQLYCMTQCEPRVDKQKAQKSDLLKMYTDYDLDSYRKVVNVWSFDEAGQQQSDYLFSLEYVFAQQTYFSYVLGNYGFDLVTWHILKDWIDTREKMFALKRRVYFDDRRQLLRLQPEPTDGQRFVGILGCYVERAIKDMIMERWVYQYAQALSKITIGNIRGKFTQVSMFGGGTINYNDLLSQGLEEKKQLEEEIMFKHGEVSPNQFFVG